MLAPGGGERVCVECGVTCDQGTRCSRCEMPLCCESRLHESECRHRIHFPTNTSRHLGVAILRLIDNLETRNTEQREEIMQLMKDADAVLVAGGDGTVMEVVTGLMRREDRDAAAQVPIGILPVGKNNLTAKSLFPGAENQVRLLGEATMAVVRQLRRPTGVMEVNFGPLDFEVHTYYIFSGGKPDSWQKHLCHEPVGPRSLEGHAVIDRQMVSFL